MKKRFLILMMAGLLLAGCGGNADNGNVAENDSVQNGSVTGEDETGVSDTATSENSTENSTEQEVYVLEFTDAATVDGGKMSADVFANSKLTMINVWATFCGPCINEMPDLGEIAGAYDAADFQMIGIVSDVVEGDEDMLAEAKEIIDETGANYPHLLLNEELYMNLVGASDSVPTTYFFNQEGELLGYLVGAQSKAAWEEIINGLLEEMQ